MLTIKRKTTVELSWEAITTAAKVDKLHELLCLGDEIPVELKTGEQVVLQLVDLTPGDRPCFMLKDCLKEEQPMNKTNTNKSGWKDSWMREWLNGTMFHLLPDELQAIIAPRIIKQRIGGELVETEDKLWLPSFAEMFGADTDWAPADEGDAQFQLFQTERSRVKECGNRGTWWYWLRSPYGSNSTTFCTVYSSGGANSSHASNAYGVAFGFCL